MQELQAELRELQNNFDTMIPAIPAAGLGPPFLRVLSSISSVTSLKCGFADRGFGLAIRFRREPEVAVRFLSVADRAVREGRPLEPAIIPLVQGHLRQHVEQLSQTNQMSDTLSSFLQPLEWSKFDEADIESQHSVLRLYVMDLLLDCFVQPQQK